MSSEKERRSPAKRGGTLGRVRRRCQVEFQEKIGSRVGRLQYGVFEYQRIRWIRAVQRDILTHFKENGLNSRSDLVLYGYYLFTRTPSTPLALLHTFSVPQPIPQPICKHDIPPLRLKAAVN